MRPMLVLAMLALGCAAPGAGADAAAGPSGTVRFFKVANSAFDRYTASPSPDRQEWMRSHYWRMLTYSPYFDSRLSWFPDAWVYKDLYAIYVGSPLASEHPEWVLRDASGNRLYIPYRCAGGTCPQYAADVGDPAFRARWTSDAAALLGKGYRGLFVDDVNMTLLRVSDGAGHAVVPIDPRTGEAMTESDWRRYMAEFTEEIRADFPAAELVHNALWLVGDQDPFVARELLSADLINLEGGASDSGIREGTGPYGFETFLSHIDWLHAHGRGVVFDGGAPGRRRREYDLAAYFLLDTGGDALGNMRRSAPGQWWSGYDVSLGSAAGARYAWNGLLRRDFANGFVLVNPPGAPPQALAVEDGYRSASGARRRSIILGEAAGAVLWKPPTSCPLVVGDAR